MSSLPTLPTVSANFSIQLPAAISVDINTHWLEQRLGSSGVLAASMTETDTTLTLTLQTSAAGSALVPVNPGNTILIDGEPLAVTARDGAQLTVTRNAGNSGAAAAHASGATVYVLKYPDPWFMIGDEALRPYAQQVATGLGSKSATFGAVISGSFTTT